MPGVSLSAWLVLITAISGLIALARSRSRRLDAKQFLAMSACAGLFAALVCAAHLGLPAAAFVLVTAVAVLAAALIETLDHTSHYYFNESAIKVAKFLPVSWSGTGAMRNLIAYGRQYLPRRHFAIMIALWSGVALCATSLGNTFPISASTLMRASIAFLCMSFWWPRRTTTQTLSAIEQRLVANPSTIAPAPLHCAHRTHNVRLTDAPVALPRTIVVIINKSAGSWITASDDVNVRLDRRLCDLSGTPDEWFVPGNAITNSPCTEISIPCMLTGAAPHEHVDRIHALPFIFDLAKARGYATAFFTSSTLEWANFQDFFSGAAIDELVSATHSACRSSTTSR